MCGLVTRSGGRSVWRAYHRGCMSRPISSLSPAASPLSLPPSRRYQRRHPLISLATPPFFIFSLLKRQMDKVYCKVGSKPGKTVSEEEGASETHGRIDHEGRREREREEWAEVIEEARDRKERGGGILVRLLAPCPVTIIKDSPLLGPRRLRKRERGEGGKNRANASLIIRSPRLEANGPGKRDREVLERGRQYPIDHPTNLADERGTSYTTSRVKPAILIDTKQPINRPVPSYSRFVSTSFVGENPIFP